MSGKHWPNSTAAYESPRGTTISAFFHQERSLKSPTNHSMYALQILHHLPVEPVLTVFSITGTHFYFFPQAPDKVVSVHLRAILYEKYVVVVVECMLNVSWMWVWYVSTVMQKDMGTLSPGPGEPWQNICDILSFMVTGLVVRTILLSFPKKCLVFILC